jgi:F0F1-type ATP synthase assembly protein I
MKNSTIINIFLALAVAGIVFGVILPWMISAADTVVVVVGLFLILCIATGTALYVNKIVKSNTKVDSQPK